MTYKDMMIKLYRVYAARGSSYHGLRHIEECFHELMTLVNAGLIENAETMRLAIWYHDFYQDHTGDDEECSANEAYSDTLALGHDEQFAQTVRRLILVTKHGIYLPETNDEQYMCDIDLFPFTADNFTERTEWIRQEYPDVPDEVFNFTRYNVLMKFLSRPLIYYTPYYQELAEVAARWNLGAAIVALGKDGVCDDAC